MISVNLGTQMIASEHQKTVIAIGMESMTGFLHISAKMNIHFHLLNIQKFLQYWEIYLI